ncbi:MAG: RT0821/Lpp0805 family surface protein [Alphaproteobacteria bacterium]
MRFPNHSLSLRASGVLIAVALVPAASAPAFADVSGFFDRIGRNTDALLESIASKEDSAFIERAVERMLAQRQPVGRTAEWENPHTGHRGTVTIASYYERGTGDPCWDYRRTLRDNREVTTYSGTACRELDSSSRSVEDVLRFRRETWIGQMRTVAAPGPAPVFAAAEIPPAATVRRTQELLVKAGFNPGPVDGVAGQRTRGAIKKYQAARALAVDGDPSPALVEKLESEVASRPAPAAPPMPKPMSVPAERQPLVLVIDGRDRQVSRPGNAPDDDGGASPDVQPLRPAIVNDWRLTSEGDVYDAAGNGGDAGTPAAIRRVKGMMDAVAQLAKLRKRPFVVVAHGRGAILAVQAIRELREARRVRAGDIHILTTFGAPGGLGRKEVASVRAVVGYWRNYWMEEDRLSKPLDGLNDDENIRVDVDPGRDGGNTHGAYYRSPRIWSRIGNDVARLATSS